MVDQNHAYQPRPCTACSGNKGKTVSSSQTVWVNGKPVTKIVQSWHPCQGCGGKGVR
jgi:DnaJ-class molecular chaperone